MMSTESRPSSSGDIKETPLQDENGNDIPPEEASAGALKRELEKISFEYALTGEEIKEAVDNRAELFKDLDALKAKLHLIQVEEGETGIDDIDESDPLRYIESDYNFFPNAEECNPENISNIENPKKCKEAMEDFVKVLQNNVHRFKHMPKGPLYKEVKIRNKKWAPLAEYVLRPYLFSFLVDNIVDGLVIQELIEQHFPGSRGGSVDKHGVVCPKYHYFAYNNPIIINSRITAMSGLELENMVESIHSMDEDWKKFLSSTISIEKIIFMENENAAFLVMSHIRSTPWHCRMAYTLDGFCVHPFPCFRTKKIRFHPRPMYLKCFPSSESLEYLLKINKTLKKIKDANSQINQKRDLQIQLLKQHENIAGLYKKAKEKEIPTPIPPMPRKIKIKQTPKKRGRLGRILF